MFYCYFINGFEIRIVDFSFFLNQKSKPNYGSIWFRNQSSDQFDFNFSPVRLNRFEGIGGRDQHNWMERNRSHPIPSHPIPPHPSPKQKASTCGHHSYPLYVARVHRVYGSRSSEMGDLKDTPIMELSTQSFYSLLANTSDSFKSQADVSTGCTVAATLRQPNHLPPPKAR